MTKKQAIKKAIAHWERMIRWAKKQNKKEFPSLFSMSNDIKEAWKGKDCELCKQFQNKADGCSNCPLYKKYNNCNTVHNLWFAVSFSRTWKEWVKNAKKFLKQIESLLEEK